MFNKKAVNDSSSKICIFLTLYFAILYTQVGLKFPSLKTFSEGNFLTYIKRKYKLTKLKYRSLSSDNFDGHTSTFIYDISEIPVIALL